jgi:hypothetical protein
MKTLEHEIRDVLNNKINLYDETLLEELALELYESGDINFDDENEDEYLTEALPLVPIIVGAARLGLSTAGRQFITGLIKKAPEIVKQIGNAIKSGGKSARNLINRINRSVARAKVRARVKSKRKNRASPRGRGRSRNRRRRFLRRPSSSSNGSSSSGVSSRSSRGTERRIEMHGDGEGKVVITKESREDIEATPRFTETDREKIDVVPRAENDLDTANRKRFRMENIKKKIIDESLNIINSRK